MILLSIIIAVRDITKELPNQIESLFKDGKKEVECIIVKDKLSALSEFEDQLSSMHGVSIVKGSHRCVYDLLNKGIEVAQGEFISFLRQDDFYLPRVIPQVLDLLRKHENDADIIHGNITVGEAVIHPPTGFLSFYHSRLFLPASFIRSKYLDICNGFNTHYRTRSDLDFFLQAKEQGARFLYTNKTFTDCTASAQPFGVPSEIRRILISHGFSFLFATFYYLCARLRLQIIASRNDRNKIAKNTISDLP